MAERIPKAAKNHSLVYLSDPQRRAGEGSILSERLDQKPIPARWKLGLDRRALEARNADRTTSSSPSNKTKARKDIFHHDPIQIKRRVWDALFALKRVLGGRRCRCPRVLDSIF